MSDKRQKTIINSGTWYCNRDNWKCLPSDSNNYGIYNSEQHCFKHCNNLGAVTANNLFQSEIIPLLDYSGMTNLFQTNRGLREFYHPLNMPSTTAATIMKNEDKEDKNFAPPFSSSSSSSLQLLDRKNQTHFLVQQSLKKLNLYLQNFFYHNIDIDSSIKQIESIFYYLYSILANTNKPENRSIDISTPQNIHLFGALFNQLYHIDSVFVTKNILNLIYKTIQLTYQYKKSLLNSNRLMIFFLNILDNITTNPKIIEHWKYLREIIELNLDDILSELRFQIFQIRSPLRDVNVLRILLTLATVNKVILFNTDRERKMEYGIKIFDLIHQVFNFQIEQYINDIHSNTIREENEHGNGAIWDCMSIIIKNDYEYRNELIKSLISDFNLKMTMIPELSEIGINTGSTTTKFDMKIEGEQNQVFDLTDMIMSKINSTVKEKNFWINFIIYCCLSIRNAGMMSKGNKKEEGLIWFYSYILHDVNFINDFNMGNSPFSSTFQNNFEDFSRWFKIFINDSMNTYLNLNIFQDLVSSLEFLKKLTEIDDKNNQQNNMSLTKKLMINYTFELIGAIESSEQEE
jgi:hypothetical protein